jgi:transposase
LPNQGQRTHDYFPFGDFAMVPANLPENLAGFAAFAGLDWADQKHDVCLQASDEARGTAFVLDHTPEAIDAWATKLREQFGGRPVAICLESHRGALMAALLKYEFLTIFPLPPKQLARYREAMSSGGAKDDPTDAALLLDYLLRHGDKLRAWKPDDSTTRELALLVEMRRKAVALRTQLTNQLTQVLKGYFPQALTLVGELYTTVACDFLLAWPTLESLQKMRIDKIRAFYYAHHCRGDLVEKRLKAIPDAVPLTTDEAIMRSSVLEAQLLAKQLRALTPSIDEFEKRIDALMKEHPDGSFFKALPGAGAALAPRLLAAFGTDRKRFATAAEVQDYSGIAPVTKRSGKSTIVHRRYACPKFIRQTFHEFSDHSRKSSAWAMAYYQSQRTHGKKHHAAIRALAFKWIRILFRCWQNRIPYNEQQYQAALKKRQSPLAICLNPTEIPLGNTCS